MNGFRHRQPVTIEPTLFIPLFSYFIKQRENLPGTLTKARIARITAIHRQLGACNAGIFLLPLAAEEINCLASEIFWNWDALVTQEGLVSKRSVASLSEPLSPLARGVSGFAFGSKRSDTMANEITKITEITEISKIPVITLPMGFEIREVTGVTTILPTPPPPLGPLAAIHREL